MRKLWERLTGIDRLKARIRALEGANHALFTSMARANDRAYDRRAALRQIIECDTPGANGTVKRMVRIAREAIETGGEGEVSK